MSKDLNFETKQNPTNVIDPGVLIVNSFLTEEQLEDILQEWEKTHGIVRISTSRVPGAES